MNDSSSKSSAEAKTDSSPQLPKKSLTQSTLTSTCSSEVPISVSTSLAPTAPPAGRDPVFMLGGNKVQLLQDVPLRP